MDHKKFLHVFLIKTTSHFHRLLVTTLLKFLLYNIFNNSTINMNETEGFLLYVIFSFGLVLIHQ